MNLIRLILAEGTGIRKGNRISEGIRFFCFMRLTVNGEIKEGIMAHTVRGLLDELRIVPGRVAVEVNVSIVKRADYETFQLKDGDVVEIVNFVGGG